MLRALLFAAAAGCLGAAEPPAPPLLLFVAGEPSHGPGEHRFPTGSRLLADALAASGLPLRTAVVQGWPEAPRLAEAASLVLFSDGLERHVARGQADALRRHVDAGRGLAVLHFALEPSPGDLADALLTAVGGRFEVDWSVNPVWRPAEVVLAAHEVTRGVRPFAVEDEWYYHLRFSPPVIPVLQARPPPGTLGQDGPRSGNPAVRAAVARGEPQTLAWVHTAAGARTFGFTGGHFHRNWWEMNFRTLVLNALVWTAGLTVPAAGVASSLDPAPKHATIDEAIALQNGVDQGLSSA
ncbi:MAG: ThuA domain-containing protein, partial [Opitutaceae bacterium]